MTVAAMMVAAAVMLAAAASPATDLPEDASRPTAVETSPEVRASKKFGDRCEEDDECNFGGGVCDKEKKLCRCLPELEVTDHIDKCGKAVPVYEECLMNEQCVVTAETECKNGICTCKGKLKPVANTMGIMECLERGTKQIGDRCVESVECGFDYGVCDLANKKCQCLPEYPVTNHFDKCGKGDAAGSAWPLDHLQQPRITPPALLPPCFLPHVELTRIARHRAHSQHLR